MPAQGGLFESAANVAKRDCGTGVCLKLSLVAEGGQHQLALANGGRELLPRPDSGHVAVARGPRALKQVVLHAHEAEGNFLREQRERHVFF